jgi:hypothetical protein
MWRAMNGPTPDSSVSDRSCARSADASTGHVNARRDARRNARAE